MKAAISPKVWLISGKVRHFSDCLIDPAGGEIPYGMEQPFYNPRLASCLASLPRVVQLYFVHCYVFVVVAEDQLLAVANYGMAVPALIGRDNIIGTQFHPEKSQLAGQVMLDSFLSWRP